MLIDIFRKRFNLFPLWVHVANIRYLGDVGGYLGRKRFPLLEIWAKTLDSIHFLICKPKVSPVRCIILSLFQNLCSKHFALKGNIMLESLFQNDLVKIPSKVGSKCRGVSKSSSMHLEFSQANQNHKPILDT
ncbi:hypothetical protein OIU79_008946 [Salix purpurea]|uniref:Uncharacterized protein n=1 Tax=Salix purpurea TaxID=77065 RepID=A0A9Q0TJK5_SALPP|nr:hypothetical protein OIU79_008946 [Salix purpurea]